MTEGYMRMGTRWYDRRVGRLLPHDGLMHRILDFLDRTAMSVDEISRQFGYPHDVVREELLSAIAREQEKANQQGGEAWRLVYGLDPDEPRAGFIVMATLP